MKDSIMVNLEWRTENGVMYNVTSSPPVPTEWQLLTGLPESISVLLQISYNTFYYITVLSTLCGQNGVTTSIDLNYGE